MAPRVSPSLDRGTRLRVVTAGLFLVRLTAFPINATVFRDVSEYDPFLGRFGGKSWRPGEVRHRTCLFYSQRRATWSGSPTFAAGPCCAAGGEEKFSVDLPLHLSSSGLSTLPNTDERIISARGFPDAGSRKDRPKNNFPIQCHRLARWKVTIVDTHRNARRYVAPRSPATA